MDSRTLLIGWFLNVNDINFKLKHKTTIGKDLACDIIIDDETVASHHVTLYLHSRFIYIVMHSSTRNTFLNRRPIINYHNAPPDSVLTIGTFSMLIKRKVELQITPTPELKIQDKQITTTN